MLRLFLAAPLAVILLAPAPAAANSCQLTQPVVDVRELPVGCPAVILSSQRFGRAFDTEIHATASRAGMPELDVTGTVDRTTTSRTVEIYRYETPESCELIRHVEQEQFDTLTVELVDAQAGDTVDIADGSGNGASVTIIAAGPCPPSDVQTLSCAAPIQFCDEDGDDVPDDLDDDLDAGGCAAGGAVGPGAALALLALGRRRRSLLA